MSLQYSFSGKKVLITGGGQGIGRQMVQRFHDDGAIVFAIDKNAETITKLKEELPNVTVAVVDLNDWDSTKTVVESFGVIDHLVNNAGLGIPQAFLDITKEATMTQFNVNLFAAINASQVVAKRLIEAGTGGTIVNICSMCARSATWAPARCTIYSTTKAALENLTKCMAIELGQHNIRVNAISPGIVNTSIHTHPIPGMKEVKEGIMQRIINKRMIETNEIVDLAMFLLSPLSTMIIGENVSIDGGFFAS